MRPRRALVSLALAPGAIFALHVAACGTDNGRAGTLEELDATSSTTPKKDTGATSSGDAGSIVEVDSGVDDSGPPPDGGACYDPGDPGGSESAAATLPDIDDCDGSGGTKSGLAAGTIDTDFYHFHAKDTFGCTINANASTTTSGIELCLFTKCLNGTTTDFKGCTSGTEKTSSLGVKGCCVSAPGKIAYDFNCGGTDDSGDVFIRVKGLTDACQPYSFSYNF